MTNDRKLPGSLVSGCTQCLIANSHRPIRLDSTVEFHVWRRKLDRWKCCRLYLQQRGRQDLVQVTCIQKSVAVGGTHSKLEIRKLPIGYNGAVHIRPQNYPIPWTDPKHQLPASSLDPSDLPSRTAYISDQPFYHNALDRQTDSRPTVRWL